MEILAINDVPSHTNLVFSRIFEFSRSGIVADGFHPSSTNIDFPFLRSVYDRGAGAPVRCRPECKYAGSPLSRRERDVERLRFLSSVFCRNALRDPRWRNVSTKAWRGCLRIVIRLPPPPSPLPQPKVSDQKFFVTRRTIPRHRRSRRDFTLPRPSSLDLCTRVDRSNSPSSSSWRESFLTGFHIRVDGNIIIVAGKANFHQGIRNYARAGCMGSTSLLPSTHSLPSTWFLERDSNNSKQPFRNPCFTKDRRTCRRAMLDRSHVGALRDEKEEKIG